MAHASLFQPFRLKSLTLANRFVMAPMTRSFAAAGVLPAEAPAYYGKRAAGGVGLIISEGVLVDRPAAGSSPGEPHFHGTAALAMWRQVIEAVHEAGGRMAPQLWHKGVVAPKIEWRPRGPFEGPSGIVRPGEIGGIAMSETDIADTIAAFACAAADARRLGFDCVEIHGAHGYLIDQFLWSETNKRTDRYGGLTLRERARFGAEVARAIRTAVGPDFVIIQRFSQWKSQDYAAKLAATPDELSDWLAPFVDAGVDIFHMSQRRFWEPEFEGSDLNLAGWAKSLTGKPTITVGSVGLSGEFIAAFRGESSQAQPIDDLARRHERGEFDLVAVGRAVLADPDWVAKLRDGRTSELRGFTPDALKTLA